jgi:colanic acid/amylovoran biosynthesis glycosyltransferase
VTPSESKPRHQLTHLVSRFPRVSETFIAREIDALDKTGNFDISLRALFPSPDTTVHPVARNWLPRLVRPGIPEAAAGLAWALRFRTVALAGVCLTVVAAHLRRPSVLVRTLVTIALASALARELSARLAADPVSVSRTRIHAHYATYPALAAWICHQFTGVPYSFTAHAHDLYVDPTMLRTKVADATEVVTISRYNQQLLTSLGTRTRITIVPCGIDVGSYQFRSWSPPKDRTVRALCVASLQQYKGHHILLNALTRGGAELDRIELDLIGDGPLRADLESQSRQLGLTERVHFLGPRTESEVRDALQHADLFVLPSIIARDGQMEGLPVALMEALACGVPAVSTTLSGIPEIIKHGVTGLLAPPGDAQALADTIASTLRDPDGTSKRARAGRDLVEREFDSDRTVKLLTDILLR